MESNNVRMLSAKRQVEFLSVITRQSMIVLLLLP